MAVAFSVIVSFVSESAFAVSTKMYWANYFGDKIELANLDGSGREVVLTTDLPIGIALDIAGDKMYWTSGSGYDIQKIQRSNLNGSGIEDLVSGSDYPYGIALDIAEGKMYWTDVATDQRFRTLIFLLL